MCHQLQTSNHSHAFLHEINTQLEHKATSSEIAGETENETGDQRVLKCTGLVQGTFGVYFGWSKSTKLYDPLKFIIAYYHAEKLGYVPVKEVEGPPALLGRLLAPEDEA